jgi:hypothetical protein
VSRVATATGEPARHETTQLLVGNLAPRLQERIEWDTAHMKASNADEADALIHKRYREGFGIAT